MVETKNYFAVLMMVEEVVLNGWCCVGEGGAGVWLYLDFHTARNVYG